MAAVQDQDLDSCPDPGQMIDQALQIQRRIAEAEIPRAAVTGKVDQKQILFSEGPRQACGLPDKIPDTTAAVMAQLPDLLRRKRKALHESLFHHFHILFPSGQIGPSCRQVVSRHCQYGI